MNASPVIAATLGADTLLRLGTAVALGLLIGLEREFAHRREPGASENELFAGARTFALFALLGWAGALLSDITASMLPFIALLVLGGALIVSAYIGVFRTAQFGMTTEVAALLTIALGALCRWTDLSLPVGLGVAVSVLLELKVRTRSLAATLAPADMMATLKFAVITAIVLPVLPRKPIFPKPFDIWVPYDLWLVVVFVSAISFLGYLLHKLIGARQGVALAGLLGGLVSSTAVTLSFARRERGAPEFARIFACGILIAWSITFARVAVLVTIINAGLLVPLWPTLLLGFLFCGGSALVLFLPTSAAANQGEENLTNPFELVPALSFGVVFGIVLFFVHIAPSYFGNAGVYLTSIISGLVEVDAITASLARLTAVVSGLPSATAAAGITLAIIANTLVKGGIAAVTGTSALRRILLPAGGGLGLALGAVWMLT